MSTEQLPHSPRSLRQPNAATMRVPRMTIRQFAGILPESPSGTHRIHIQTQGDTVRDSSSSNCRNHPGGVRRDDWPGPDDGAGSCQSCPSSPSAPAGHALGAVVGVSEHSNVVNPRSPKAVSQLYRR